MNDNNKNYVKDKTLDSIKDFQKTFEAELIELIGNEIENFTGMYHPKGLPVHIFMALSSVVTITCIHTVIKNLTIDAVMDGNTLNGEAVFEAMKKDFAESVKDLEKLKEELGGIFDSVNTTTNLIPPQSVH